MREYRDQTGGGVGGKEARSESHLRRDGKNNNEGEVTERRGGAREERGEKGTPLIRGKRKASVTCGRTH